MRARLGASRLHQLRLPATVDVTAFALVPDVSAVRLDVFVYCIGRSDSAVRVITATESHTTVGRSRHGFESVRAFLLHRCAEQQRVVEAIDSYLTRLDDAVASLERVQAKLKAYRASVLKAAVEGRLVPTEASLARAEKRDYEPAEVLLARILKERRRRWEEAELAKLKAAGKTPKDDKWKAKYQEPVAPDTSTLPELPEGWCWATVDQLLDGRRTQRPRRDRPRRYDVATCVIRLACA